MEENTHLYALKYYSFENYFFNPKNMFDCFYGRFKKEENELLSRYVALAPREEFADILDAIDRFVYFESRKV